MANLEQTADEVGTLATPPKSRYSMVVLAAKRARQLKDGAPPLIEPTSTNLLTTALQEIAAGKIGIIEAVEVPDDETPRYVRGGFLTSDYDDILADTEITSDLTADEADPEELVDDAGVGSDTSDELEPIKE